MKLLAPFLITLFFAIVSANWAPEDYEIFGLNDKVRADLGSDTTFYSWLGLANGPKSSRDAIQKAYRKVSRQLHPDKAGKGSRALRKKAEDRFQRLSSVGNILKDPNLKKRYDYFLSNGFPKWKGTGYYYSRFRPGMGFTLSVLYLLVSTFQYISLRIGRKQDFKRVTTLKNDIKTQAWSGSFIPPSDGSARRVTSGMGKDFHVSPTGEVSLIETNEKGEMVLELLDEYDINVNPGFRESYFFRIPVGIWNFSVGRIERLHILNESGYVNPNRAKKQAEELREQKEKQQEKANKKNSRSSKVELANGKVMYSRKRK